MLTPDSSQSVPCEMMPINYTDSKIEYCNPEYSPIGHYIAYAFDNIIGFYDPINKCSMSTHLMASCKKVMKLKYSPDGKMLAASGPTYQKSSNSYKNSYTITLFDTVYYQILRILEWTEYAYTLDFSQNGSKLISGYQHSGSVRIWDTKSGNSRELEVKMSTRKPGQKRGYFRLDCVKYLDNDQSFLLSHERSGIQIRNDKNKIKQFKYQSHLFNVYTFSKQLQLQTYQIISLRILVNLCQQQFVHRYGAIGYSELLGQICFWNARIGSYKIFNLRDGKYRSAMTYSPRSKLIMLINSNKSTISICGGNIKKLIKQFPSSFGRNIRSAQFSPDGKFYLEYHHGGFAISPLFQ